MKTFIFVLCFVAFVPQLCEVNSLVGFRIFYNYPKGLFHFNRKAQTVDIITALVSVTLCALQTIIAFINWRSKALRLYRGRYGAFNYTSRRRRVESNIERIMFKSGDNFIPVTAASGTLVRLNGHTLEMLIWFILHEQLCVNLRVLRLFPINRRGPVYTVEQILEGNTKEFRTLQRFIFKDYTFGRCGRQHPPIKGGQRMPLQMYDHSKRRTHKEVETLMATTCGTEESQAERCEEMVKDPCVAVKPERDTAGEESRGEAVTELYANSADNCESGYGPANAMRKALTIVFSKVKRDHVGESYGAEVEGCEDNTSTIKSGLKTLECDSDAKEEMSKINNSLETLECDSDAREEMSKINNSLQALECDSDANEGMSNINNTLEARECDSDAREGMSKINNNLETLECDSDAKEEMISESDDSLEDESEREKHLSTKERIHHMTEMISSMFDSPFVGTERFDGNESSLDLKMESLTEQNAWSSCFFDEDAMQKKYEDERVLCSTDMCEDIKMTIKAYYGMAGGFIDPLEQVKHEEKKAYNITSQEWKSLVSIFSKDVSIKESVETGKEYRYCGVWSTQELTGSQCSLVELQEETVFADMEKKANCCHGWDCSKIAIGGGVMVLGLFAVYACVRR